MDYQDEIFASYERAREAVDEVIRNPQIYGLPEVSLARVAAGGVVHFVWELNTVGEKFYLKIRGDRFARIPGIKTSPTNIAYEYKALRLLSTALPDHFPHVVHFSAPKALLITKDAIPNGEYLEKLLHTRTVTSELLVQLGKTLSKVHDATRLMSESIRENSDENFYNEKLDHKLRFRDHPVLNKFVQEMVSHEPRQIIIGDPSPKNIGVNDNGARVVFFDLEDVHRGNVVFDVGFFIGHLFLHAYADNQLATGYVERFLQGYGNKGLNSCLVKVIALGVILYRLDSIVPYAIDLNDEKKLLLGRTVETALNTLNFGSVTWRGLIDRVCTGV
jgi:hypothetical protein